MTELDVANIVSLAGETADLSRALAMAIEAAPMDDVTRNALHALAGMVAEKCAELSTAADSAEFAE